MIRLVKPPKEKFSWAKEILALDIDHTMKVEIKYAKTITPIISRDVKVQEPEREFSTDRKSEPKYLLVKRIK